MKRFFKRFTAWCLRLQGRCGICGQTKYQIRIPTKGFRNPSRCLECGQFSPVYTVDKKGKVKLVDTRHPARNRSTTARGW